MTVNRVVYKYAFEDPDAELLVPAGRILHVAAQRPADPLPTVWIEHELVDLDRMRTRRLRFEATGQRFDIGFWEFAGTAVCADGHLVWHVYTLGH